MTVYDLYTFGSESLLSCSFSSDLQLIKGDIRDEEHLKKAMQNVDVIVHLAAIVSAPACENDPNLAITTNIEGTENITKNLRADQKLVYASTGSCYGAVANGMCTEETPLNPLSLYGTSKRDAEQLVIKANGVGLRLATIFGISPRLRLDLMINTLVHRALTGQRIEVYETHFKRTFLHVRDVARAFLFAIENYDKMKGDVFNVGGDEMNYTKEQIFNIIKELFPDCWMEETNGQDSDKRDYQVSYEKIRKLGYTPSIGITEGIDELRKVLPYLSPEFVLKTKNS